MAAVSGQSETIIILDFGSQYAQLIARRVREKNVYSILAHPDVTAEELKKYNPKGLIFTGIDVIGGWMTEINVTSPTGIQELERFDGTNVAAVIWEAIEKRRAG